MGTDLVIVSALVLVFVALPVYMWRRHGWNIVSETASTILDLVRSMLP